MNFYLMGLALVGASAGGALALQSVVNASLGRRIGTIEATFVSVSITWVLVVLLLSNWTAKLEVLPGYLGTAISSSLAAFLVLPS